MTSISREIPFWSKKKINFQKWSGTKGTSFQKGSFKFQISSFKCQRRKKKIFFKGLQKSIKVFFFKREIQINQIKKRERKVIHLKTMEQQITHHLKSKFQILIFCRRNPKFQGREAPWLPSIKIEVVKPLGHHKFKIEIEKPLNCPKFQGREAPSLPSIQIEVEKPLGRSIQDWDIETSQSP